jgi:hypothetical protein
MDHGRIVERGRYADLLAAGGRFTELARRQLLQPPDPPRHGGSGSAVPSEEDRP